jgi:hypothetical protein
VTPGFMRNVLYPRKIARYIVGEELKTLLKSEDQLTTIIQRDRSFVIPPDAIPEEKPFLEPTGIITVSYPL